MAAADGRSFYKPELDLLRFAAFVLVFVYHFLPPQLDARSRAVAILHTGCEQGVQIFFLLSAYLITGLLLQERARTGTVHVAAFYVRRVLRIWPLYLFLIFAAFLCTRLGLGGNFGGAALAHFLLLSGNWFVVQHGWLASVVAPLWTISVEEQFYLLWPATLRRFGRTGLLALSAALVLLAYATLAVLGSRHVAEYAVRANSLVQFQFFAVGAGLAMLLHNRQFRPGVAGRAGLFTLGGAAVSVAVWRFHLFAQSAVQPSNLLAGYCLLAVSATCAFLGFLDAKLPRWMNWPVYCGRISYGLYAFHFIAFVWSEKLLHTLVRGKVGAAALAVAHASLAMALCFGMAVASYHWLETPFLRLKQRFTFVSSRDDVHLGKQERRSTGDAEPLAA